MEVNATVPAQLGVVVLKTPCGSIRRQVAEAIAVSAGMPALVVDKAEEAFAKATFDGASVIIGVAELASVVGEVEAA